MAQQADGSPETPLGGYALVFTPLLAAILSDPNDARDCLNRGDRLFHWLMLLYRYTPVFPAKAVCQHE